LQGVIEWYALSFCTIDLSQTKAYYKEKKGKRCPYMPEPGDESKMVDFRDYVLVCLHIPYG
jgi:hypothetical protein